MAKPITGKTHVGERREKRPNGDISDLANSGVFVNSFSLSGLTSTKKLDTMDF